MKLCEETGDSLNCENAKIHRNCAKASHSSDGIFVDLLFEHFGSFSKAFTP